MTGNKGRGVTVIKQGAGCDDQHEHVSVRSSQRMVAHLSCRLQAHPKTGAGCKYFSFTVVGCTEPGRGDDEEEGGDERGRKREREREREGRRG